MGTMAMRFAVFFIVLAELTAIIGIFLPFHSTSFYTAAGLLKAVRMTTYTLKLDLDFSQGRGGGSNDVCWLLDKVPKFPKRDFCKEDRASMGLNEARERFCAPATQRVFEMMCEAMGYAHKCGLSFVIVVLLDVLANGIAAYLTYHYLYEAHKKKYRELATILVVAGLVLTVLWSLMYFFLVNLTLDHLKSQPGVGIVIQNASGNLGTQIGYMVMWIAILFKVIALVLYKNGKTKEETREAEFKEQMEFAEDMQKVEMSAGMMPGSMNPNHGYGYGYNMNNMATQNSLQGNGYPQAGGQHGYGYNNGQQAGYNQGGMPMAHHSSYPQQNHQYPQQYQPQQYQQNVQGMPRQNWGYPH